jgi:hypothetical protein
VPASARYPAGAPDRHPIHARYEVERGAFAR